MINTNYHTHTRRCNHAEGSDEDYVKAAIAAGFSEIGFSDHSPWPAHPFETSFIRMKIALFPDYVNSIKQLQKKYEKEISIKIGLECEYFEDRMEWLKKSIDQYQLDYIILGNHFHKFETHDRYYGFYRDKKNLLLDYLSDSVAALDTGMYSAYAHPDIFVRSLERWSFEAEKMSEMLLLKARDSDVPVEYNLGGVRSGNYGGIGYPYPRFWELAAAIGNEVIIGIDAHSPMDFHDTNTILAAEKYLHSLGIKPITKLRFKK